MKHSEPYDAYLVRLWPTVRGGTGGYRVSVQCVASGERTDLPDLQSLLSYLQSQGDLRNNRERIKSP